MMHVQVWTLYAAVPLWCCGQIASLFQPITAAVNHNAALIEHPERDGLIEDVQIERREVGRAGAGLPERRE